MVLLTTKIFGMPDKMTAPQQEALRAVIALPGLTKDELIKEFAWKATPSPIAMEHRIKGLDKRGLIKRTRPSENMPFTIYPTQVGISVLKALEPAPLNPYCITCKISFRKQVPVLPGKRFCREHTDLFARLAQECIDEANAKFKTKIKFRCKMIGCHNPRPQNEDFCYSCREPY